MGGEREREEKKKNVYEVGGQMEQEKQEKCPG